jgi:CRISPR/Cas system CSM-associated protein Csm2 small subunit
MEGFAIQLYKCLRQMMLHIINLKEMHMKKTQLRQVYEWFFQRLKAIGALSKQEIEEEFKFLNPDHG